MLKIFDKRIRVTFLDDSTGEILGIVKLKQEQLPESFDKPTTLQFREKNWHVVQADPAVARDFVATKS